MSPGAGVVQSEAVAQCRGHSLREHLEARACPAPALVEGVGRDTVRPQEDLGAEDLFKKSFGGERWTRQIKLP